MKKLISTLLLLTLNVCLYSEEINHINLLEFLNDKQFFSSNFSQLTIQNFKEREVQGRIRANRMGKFKIEYYEPIQEVISADGTFLYKLDLELEQLDVVPQEDVFAGTPINLFTSSFEDLNDLYTVKPCVELADILMCEILPKSEESFLEKLYINFKDSTLHSLKYFDSFDQTVELNFDRVIWLPFDESELLISVPEGIDVVYH